MNKITTILGASALILSANIMADVQFSSPNTNADPEAPKAGIGYEWTVSLPHHGSAEITGSVGGKGSFEPTFEAPEFGWMHTTDWVALTLEEDSILEITVTRQEGIYEKTVDRKDPTIQGYKTAGAMLYPAVSLYSGWDSTLQEDGSFNPAGTFSGKEGSATTLNFIAVEYSKFGESTITYRAKMAAGQYTVNIGGVNALYCSESDECYNGKHGYRATFKTSHVPGMSM